MLLVLISSDFNCCLVHCSHSICFRALDSGFPLLVLFSLIFQPSLHDLFSFGRNFPLPFTFSLFISMLAAYYVLIWQGFSTTCFIITCILMLVSKSIFIQQVSFAWRSALTCISTLINLINQSISSRLCL